MKNIFCLLLAAGSVFTASAKTGSGMSRWYLGINAKGGVHSYDAEQINIAGNYLNVVNPQVGEVIYTPGSTMGFDFQVAYFIGKNANFGLGTGLLYLKQTGDATLDKFHVEYQNSDFNNYVYRQVINLKAPIAEDLKATNVNIPVLIKYRAKLSNAFGLSLDAGIVYNLSMRSEYTTNASFDYEALYKFQRMSNGNWQPVYDDAVVPDKSGWAGMTVAEFERTKPTGDANAYFESLRNEGYNVGLNQKPRATGYKSYAFGSVGFLVQPSLTFRISEVLSINVGAYYLYQTFEVPGESSYQLTSTVGSYSSILGAHKKVRMQNYGASLGLGFNL